MMASFSIGYHTLCERNIRHIYTTTDLKPAAVRKSPTYKPEFLAEQGRQLKRKEYNRRFMEYVPKYSFELPRAAAFDARDSAYISTVVSRLHRERKPDFAARFVPPPTPDWQRAAEDKKQRLKYVLEKFGRSKKTSHVALKTKLAAENAKEKLATQPIQRKGVRLPSLV